MSMEEIGLRVGDIVIFIAPWDGYRKTRADHTVLLEDGMEGEVLRVYPASPGTGRILDYDDSGDPVRDEDRDGYAEVRWSSGTTGLIHPPRIGAHRYRWRKK